MERMVNQPAFYVGAVPVYGDVVLSPMAGFSDVPYRALCRAYGSAMNYTEFVPVEALQGRPDRSSRFWRRLDHKPDERPLVFQIFGNDAQMILQAARRIEELGPDIIDINMGCSTRRVSGRGAGVGMMPQPALVAATFSLLARHLQVPVSGKLRLGWDDEQRNYAEIAQIMVENGAALVALHARTKAQKYDGRADWDQIARLRQLVAVPVIGNGDVASPEDIERMKAHTGCDAVMVGRAAIGNPWIFARRRREDVGREEVFEAVAIHLTEMVAYYGERAGVVQFRKHLKGYMELLPEAAALLPDLLECEEQEAVLALLRRVAEPA